MNKKEKKQYINVFVRVRPLNQNEGVKNCIEIHGSKELKIKTHNSKNYTFDRVFHEGCGQLDVYLTVAEPIVNEVISGYNCTILAYGQTGTGKTYTMTGGAPESEEAPTLSWEQDKHAGIIPRTLAHMFNALRAQQLEYTVRVSYLELYNEEIFDLLSPLDDHSKLKLYDDSLKKGSVIVQGLSEVTVNSKQEVYNILEKGADKRRIAATLMNANSSRSHTVFCITVHTKENSVDGEDLLKTGKLYLVDLAGSENIKQSGATDIRARETFSINQSLLTLGRCINKLTEKAMHVPYRESKLTRLLQDSLGGRTKTTLIATISPSYINLDETINTLEYANRAKHITNKPEVNQRLSKNALIKEYTEEIDRLRKDLLAARSGTGFYCNKENYEELERDLVKHQALVTDKIGMIKVLQEEMAHKEHALFAVKMSLSEEQEQKRILVSDLEKKLEEAINKIGTLTEANSIKEFMLEVNHTTENELKTTAKELLKVADTSVTDNERLHIKMENIIDIHDKNKIMYDQCLGDFNAQFSEIKNRMDTLKLHESECEGKLSDSLKGLSNIKQRYDKLNADMKAEIELLRTTVTSSTEEIDDSKTTFDKELSDAAKDLIRQVQDNDKSVTNTVYKKLIPYLTAANQEVNEINSYSKSVIDGVQVTVTEHFDQARRLLSNLRIIMEKSQDSVINFLDSKYSLADDFCYAAQKRQKEVILKKQNQLQFEIESSISQLNNLKRQLIKTKNITFDFTQDVHSHEEMHANNYLEFKSNFAENKDLVANLMEQTTSTLTAYEKEINCFSSLHHERVNKAIDYLQDKKTDIHNNFVNAQGKLITCIESDVHKQNEELRNKITSHLLKNQKKLNDITIAQLNNFSEIEKIGEDFSKKTELVTQDLHSNVMNQEKELGATMDTMKSVMSDFSSDTLTNLEYCRAKYKELYTDKLFKTYQETGLTPARKQYKYPRTIPDTLSFDKLLEKYEETKKSRSDEMKSSELEDNDHMTPSKPSMLKMRRSISENNLQSINSEDISPTKVPLSEMTVKSKNVDVKCLIPRFGENLKKKD